MQSKSAHCGNLKTAGPSVFAYPMPHHNLGLSSSSWFLNIWQEITNYSVEAQQPDRGWLLTIDSKYLCDYPMFMWLSMIIHVLSPSLVYFIGSITLSRQTICSYLDHISGLGCSICPCFSSFKTITSFQLLFFHHKLWKWFKMFVSFNYFECFHRHI